MKNQELVVLKGGTGKKREFNGNQAKILKRRGSWINVQLQEEQGGLRTIKWRSKAFDPVRTQNTVKNLFVSLPDDIIPHILSFLFGEGATTNWLDVRLSIRSLIFLNKGFHEKLFSSILPKTRFSANLMHLVPAQTFYAMIGIQKCNFKLVSVQVGDVGHWDLDFVATLFCNHWDVSAVTCLKIKLRERKCSAFTRMIRPRVSHPATGSSYTQVGAYVFTLDEIHDDVTDYIQIPAYANMTIPRFHALILERFQNLTTLRTAVEISTATWDNMQTYIFQIHSIRTLDLTLQFVDFNDFHDHSRGLTPQGLKCLTNLISEMPNLENLIMRDGIDGKFHGEEFTEHYSLRSPVLRTAHFANLSKGFFLIDCVCPNLERFICSGGVFGNGVRKADPRVFANREFPNGSHQHPVRRPSIDFTIRDQPLFGMHVPDDCIVAFVS
jgi:hypothetical protein